MKTKGILIFALGHPYYGRMAFNLAVSIKHMDPDAQIAMLFAGSALNELFRYDITKYVDILFPVSKECYTKDGKIEYLKAKTYLYDLTPFDETLYLDADMLWHPRRKATTLMNSLSNTSLAFENRDSIDMAEKKLPEGFSMWADIREIKSEYGLKKGHFYNLQSEFIWFKKNAKNESLFTCVKEVYENLRVKTFKFNGGIPDEIPFAIAMMLSGVYPHTEPFIPVFWEHQEKENKRAMYENVELLFNQYWAYSAGGSYYTKSMKDFYNNLATWYFNQQGLQYPYLLINKKEFLPDRKNL